MRRASEPIARTETSAQVIDLLAPLDPARELSGSWRLTDGVLYAERSQRDVLQFPYHPPAEYDFRVEFTRTQGGDAIIMVLPKNKTRFSFVMDGFQNHSFGFERINNVTADRAPPTVRLPRGIVNGVRHTALVQVRNDSVTAWLDGSVVTTWGTDYRNMSPNADQADPRSVALAPGTAPLPSIRRKWRR